MNLKVTGRFFWGGGNQINIRFPPSTSLAPSNITQPLKPVSPPFPKDPRHDCHPAQLSREYHSLAKSVCHSQKLRTWKTWSFSHLHSHVHWPAAPGRTGQSLSGGLSNPVGPWGYFQSDPRFRSWVWSGMEEDGSSCSFPGETRKTWSGLAGDLSRKRAPR